MGDWVGCLGGADVCNDMCKLAAAGGVAALLSFWCLCADGLLCLGLVLYAVAVGALSVSQTGSVACWLQFPPGENCPPGDALEISSVVFFPFWCLFHFGFGFILVLISFWFWFHFGLVLRISVQFFSPFVLDTKRERGSDMAFPFRFLHFFIFLYFYILVFGLWHIFGVFFLRDQNTRIQIAHVAAVRLGGFFLNVGRCTWHVNGEVQVAGRGAALGGWDCGAAGAVAVGIGPLTRRCCWCSDDGAAQRCHGGRAEHVAADWARLLLAGGGPRAAQPRRSGQLLVRRAH
jgi:hypothetical protein